MSLFKQKSTPTAKPPAIGPAGKSLSALLRQMTELDAKRLARHDRIASFASVVADPEPARVAQEREALEQSIAARAVASVVNGVVDPTLHDDRARLQSLTARHAELTERTELVKKAQAELHAQSETLLQERRALALSLNRLVLDALMERMESMIPALAEAEAQYRAQLRRVFTYAAAIDQVSTSNRLGVYVDALRYTLHVPQNEWPRTEAFGEAAADRDVINADFAKVEQEAQELIGRLIKGDPHDEPSSPSAN